VVSANVGDYFPTPEETEKMLSPLFDTV